MPSAFTYDLLLDPHLRARLLDDHAQSASQPSTPSRRKLRHDTRRPATADDGRGRRPALDDPFLVGVAAIRKSTFYALRTRLESRSINLSGLDERYLTWGLPRTDEAEPWKNLLDDPLFASSHLVDGLLHLRPSTIHSEPPSPTTTNFYIRTFVFTVNELLHVLQRLLDDGLEYSAKLFQWIERIRDVKENKATYIRYCGQTTGKTSFHRHRKDLNYTSGSFKIRFLQTTRTLYPEVIERTIVQELIDAEVIIPVDQSIIDLREQTVIGLFENGSLNTEAGGLGIVFEPSVEDRKSFWELGTRVTCLLTSRTTACSQKVLSDVRLYACQARSYANNYPISTGSHIGHFSKELEDIVYEDAIPNVLRNGWTPMVTIGSDIAVDRYKNPVRFFWCPGRGPQLAASTLSYFCSWEQSHTTGRIDQHFARKISSQHALPFVNLFP